MGEFREGMGKKNCRKFDYLDDAVFIHIKRGTYLLSGYSDQHQTDADWHCSVTTGNETWRLNCNCRVTEKQIKQIHDYFKSAGYTHDCGDDCSLCNDCVPIARE